MSARKWVLDHGLRCVLMALAASAACPAAGVRAQSGPDLVVIDFPDTLRWGAEDGKTALSIGTTSCNIGDEPAQWCEGVFPCPDVTRHPVIAQNLYRLKDQRFEQIGASWVKHGYWASNEDSCGGGECQDPGAFGTLLGVHCADVYFANFNGAHWRLGPRSQVNPVTGVFPYPFEAPPVENVLSRRVQVADADLDPVLNEGAKYFAEGIYIARDDAEAGHALNNASYRRAKVKRADGGFNLEWTQDPPRPQQPAITAWAASDPGVRQNDLDLSGDGRLTLSHRVTRNDDGTWHYEYALFNMNSHRAVGAFSIPVPRGAGVRNIGFHDVDPHSGDGEEGGRYSGEDWDGRRSGAAVEWATDPYEVDVNANALRWGTLYNFRFDADLPPGDAAARLGLFRPGEPAAVQAAAAAPTDEDVVPCEEVRRIRSTCDPRGEVRVTAVLRSRDLDGGLVVWDVDGRLVEATIHGRRGRAKACCFEPDPLLSWVHPLNCRPPAAVRCDP